MSKYMGFRKKEWFFLVRWTVATVVGCTVGSPFMLGVMFVFALGASGGSSPDDITYLTLIGLIIGASIGFGQTFALIGQAKQPILWLPVSILGGTLGGFLVGLVSRIRFDLVYFSIIAIPGIFICIAQKFVLMKFLKKANGWIIANIISWTLAQILFIAGLVNMESYTIFNRIEDELPFGRFINLIITLASVAVIGFITGINLTWLLKNFKKE